MQVAPKSKIIYVFENGNRLQEEGIRVLLHPKDFTNIDQVKSFLSSKVTSGLLVQKIYTPDRKLVKNIEEFNDGGKYISCGSEHFDDINIPIAISRVKPTKDDGFLKSSLGSDDGPVLSRNRSRSVSNIRSVSRSKRDTGTAAPDTPRRRSESVDGDSDHEEIARACYQKLVTLDADKKEEHKGNIKGKAKSQEKGKLGESLEIKDSNSKPKGSSLTAFLPKLKLSGITGNKASTLPSNTTGPDEGSNDANKSQAKKIATIHSSSNVPTASTFIPIKSPRNNTRTQISSSLPSTSLSFDDFPPPRSRSPSPVFGLSSKSPRALFVVQSEKGKHVTFFRNADKHHAGFETVIPHKKFRDFSQLVKFLCLHMELPTGNVHKIVTLDGKVVKGLDDIQDGHRYICCGAEGFKEDQLSNEASMW